ncbi:putative serine threonine-protein kinase vps15-like protein [Lasius niger]|uniref:Putative serine threonine-protein kinase vps15-like protein n=1 Tax=Lasius niger TaxID=67767 RepID=A0A0J7L989_LASNI|nr:putative serine threonine-protein kinase vps15-like protein [Lasius niger]
MALGVRLCLPVLFACVIVSTSVVQGRNLRRRHGRHFYSDYYQDFEESVPRDLSRRLEDDLEFQQYPYRRQMERRESSGVVDRPAEYEERISPPLRYKHTYDLRNYAESLRRKSETRRQKDLMEDASMKFVVRRKRHNKRSSNQISSSQAKSRWLKQQYEVTERGLLASYEVEVKEAQNSSICNYNVESIPDTRGTRMPKDLQHIKCNHAGRKCHNTGDQDYCCIQTYRYVNVSYSDSKNPEKKIPTKIYVGCVCASHLNNHLRQSEDPRLDD